MVKILRRFLHRFYDLLSGGEAVILSFVRAFPDDRHLLVFNRYSATAVSEELRSLSNVSGRGIEGQDFAHYVTEFRPDVLFFHWYPPMSAVDFAGLPRETLNRGILFNHWFSEIPYVAELREYWFPSPTSLAEAGGGHPGQEVQGWPGNLPSRCGRRAASAMFPSRRKANGGDPPSSTRRRRGCSLRTVARTP